MTKTAPTVVAALRFLAANPRVLLQRSYLQSLALVLRTEKLFVDSGIHLSFDLIDATEKTWQLAASTDDQAPIGTTYGFDYGLTGWAAKYNRHTPLHITDRASLPHGVKLIDHYREMSAAFLYLLSDQKGLAACLCLSSNSEDAIHPEAILEVRQIGALLSALSENLRSSRPASPLQRWPRPLLADPSLVSEWIGERVDEAGYPWVDFWEWNAEKQILTPYPLSKALRQSYSGWLSPLKLGEGFVGVAAKRLTPVLERDIVNGLGTETGLSTPLAFIQPDLPLRALIAYPVKDEERLFGVLAFLGETRDHFSSADTGICQEIATDYASVLHDITERKLAALQRNIKEDLFDALVKTDTPTAYWRRLSGVLQLIESHHFGAIAYFFVSKKNNRPTYACKAASSRAAATLGANLDSLSHPEMRIIHRLGHGNYPLKRLAGTPSFERLERMGISSLWVDSFRSSPQVDERPELLAVVGLLPQTPHSPGLGRRDPAQLLEAIFTSIFTTTRAVLNSADSIRLATERERLMLAGTHELRSPVNSIRAKADAMRNLDSANLEYRNDILAEAEGLMLRVDNILYPGSDLSERQEVDVAEFCEDQIESIRRSSPHQTTRLDQAPLTAFPGLSFCISRHWMSVAFQNLLSNAVKFGQESPILLRLDVTQTPEQSASKHSEVSNCTIRFTLQDHGIGIPKSELERIFDSGHQNPHSRDYNVLGSQIGLSITRDIINEHGGKIWARSTVGQGSRFFVELPGLLRRRSL